jgi:hypothetical protein
MGTPVAAPERSTDLMNDAAGTTTVACEMPGGHDFQNTFVERRFWSNYPKELYSKEEWKQFIASESPGKNARDIQIETERLWSLACVPSRVVSAAAPKRSIQFHEATETNRAPKLACANNGTQTLPRLFVEKRFWQNHPDELYTKAEWKQFAIDQAEPNEDPKTTKARIDRLWTLARSRLCDQPCTPMA